MVIRRNMERLRDEVEEKRETWKEYTDDYDELMAENERLRALLAIAEGKDKRDDFNKKFKIKVDKED